ncbi:YbdD/YjiX family protein [Dyella sp.]|uniref:YbdD/YjiX family protein n=1 Tax=Dyella sp. TaxID=1869338 RepID=UPI002B47BA8E|nr:YbdD/YjiX family protein [Dyella sp.]HKT27926.1 YbdD/YjiX family protein [Dyella sp.]
MTLHKLWQRLVQTARLSCGVPDYDVYVAHLRAHHPERKIPTYAEFFRDRQTARYKGTGGRCC